VSINGAPAQTYPPDSPATVHAGDVLTWANAAFSVSIDYLPNIEADVVKTVMSTSPYKIEAVDGAALISLYIEG
jgi:hypothetical protein